MDGLVNSDGLDILIINNFNLPARTDWDEKAADAVRQGVRLQREFYPPKDVLRFIDSVGTAEERVGLDGRSPVYHHLYAMHESTVVGMRVTDEIDLYQISCISGLGLSVMEYIPALSRDEDVASALSGFSGHLTVPAEEYFARFALVGENDSREAKALRLAGFRPAADAPIWTPPLNAGTVRGYRQVQREHAYMWAVSMQGGEVRLPGVVAVEFFSRVIEEGFADERLDKLRLVARELPAVVRTRESVKNAADRNNGSVVFR